jgi:Tol biopolymer transport system component
VVGNSGSPVRLLGRVWDAAWSADGRQIVYSTFKGEIYTIPSAGGEPHLIRTVKGTVPSDFAYSPDGTRISFTRDAHTLMEMTADGSNLHQILAGWHPTDIKCCGFWAPDGSLFLFFSAMSSEVSGLPSYQIWAVDERRHWLRKPPAEPVQLTFGPMTWSPNAAFSRDGRKIFVSGDTHRGELIRYNRTTEQFEPFLGGISADMVDISRDGKSILYAPFPGNNLLRANEDGTGVQQVFSALSHPEGPRWSPDGSRIMFTDGNYDGPHFTYVVSSQGGPPVRVLPDNKCCNEGDPTWSPDGKQIAVWVESHEGKTETELKIVNISTNEVSYLPSPPKRTWSPRWSPDGRYIVCVTNPYPNTDGLEVFDFKLKKWKILLTELGSGNWPSWSRDSRWIYYFMNRVDRYAVLRISVDGGRPERVTDLRGFHGTGWFYGWYGLDSNDNPLMLREAGDNEIYALTLEQK